MLASPSPSGSSASPEPEPTNAAPPKPTKKSKLKSRKGKGTDARNEGKGRDWAWKAPRGSRLVNHRTDAGEFDWDSVKNDEDVELWLVRVPDDLKLKHLSNAEIDPPTSSRSALIGSLNQKKANYDIWSVGDDDELPVGGEEVKSLSCLLPRKEKGKLYAAPKPFARHIVISAQPPQPTMTLADPAKLTQNPPRFSYPKEVLSHRFLPYGAHSSSDTTPELINVDVEMEVQEEIIESTAPVAAQVSPTQEKKKKKRKVEGETPKKSKKIKIAV